MKSNKYKITALLLITLVFCALISCEFIIGIKTSRMFVLGIEGLVGLTALIIIFTLQTSETKKIFAFLAIIITYIFIIPLTGLWKTSAAIYIHNTQSEYLDLLSLLDPPIDANLEYISCKDGQPISRPAELGMSQSDTEAFCRQLAMLDAIELIVDKSLGAYIFVMNRVIDNGYGIAYIEDSNYFNGQQQIRGFQITTHAKLLPKWYYVSFT